MKLAKKKAKGKLPSPGWIQKNGYKALSMCMYVHPELFKHIEQDRARPKEKTSKEWVKIAEKLVKDNKDVLHSHTWLNRNGYYGLSSCIRRSPELFKHLKQNKIHKSSEEWIEIAENIAKNNNGVLPDHKWLIDNGYSNFYSYFYNHPNIFKHIKHNIIRDNRKSPREQVKVAQKMAEDNNGVMPCGVWLKSNNYGLYKCMIKYPEFFKHIKQENKGGKTPEEHLKDTQKLIKENNGILPKYNWLKKNGYNGLTIFMVRNSELFKGMKQEYRNGVRIIGE
jgi:hypothetical protein